MPKAQVCIQGCGIETGGNRVQLKIGYLKDNGEVIEIGADALLPFTASETQSRLAIQNSVTANAPAGVALGQSDITIFGM